MAKQNFIIVEQAQLSSDPSDPASGFSIIYPKTDNNWYIKNSDGSIFQIQTSSGVSEELAIAYAIAL